MPLEMFSKVKIKGLEGGHAFVDAMMETVEGRQYRVVYWHNGERKSVWMYKDELEVISAT